MSHKYPLCLVTWEDCAGLGRWHSVEEAQKSVPIEVATVGWVLVDTPAHVVIVGSLDETGSCSNRDTIPRVQIKSIQGLRARSKRGA